MGVLDWVGGIFDGDGSDSTTDSGDDYGGGRIGLDDDPGDGGSVSWGDITGAPSIPDWIYNPQAWLAGVLIGWILDLWDAFLGYVDAVWSTLAGIPEAALYEPLVAAFSAPGTAIQDAWREVGTVAMDVSESAGPLAPLVVVGVWLIPMMMAIGGVYFLIGFIGTYLPLRSIPGLRRFA